MVAEAIGPERSDQEAEHLAQLLATPAGAEVLDVPCGGGRIALALVRRGYRDGAVCVGNSFGYLNDTGNADFLQAVRAALKPWARFVLETRAST